MTFGISYIIYNKIKNELYDESIKLLFENKNEISNQEYYSLLIRCHVGKKQYVEVENLLFDNKLKLMKRDYMLYVNELYTRDILKSINVFNFMIKNYEINSKDIDFLINNNLRDLFLGLNNVYINTSLEKNVSNIDCKLKILNFDDLELNKICEIIKDKINIKCLNVLKNKIQKYKYKYVLDGGNILLYNKGKTNFKSYKFLISMLEKLKDENPLLVIHHKYLKKGNNKNINNLIDNLYKNYKNNIFTTPYKNNDDYYILYSSLILRIPIISNDNFKDHIFFVGQKTLKNFLNRYVLKYDNLNIETIKTYSKCIQIIDGNIYIPTKNGNFYKL